MNLRQGSEWRKICFVLVPFLIRALKTSKVLVPNFSAIIRATGYIPVYT